MTYNMSSFGIFSNLQYQYSNTNNIKSGEFFGIYANQEDFWTLYKLNRFIYLNYKKIPNLPKKPIKLNLLLIEIIKNSQSRNIITIPNQHINKHIDNILQKIIEKKNIILKLQNNIQLQLKLVKSNEKTIEISNEEHKKYQKIKHFLANPYITITLYNNVKNNKYLTNYNLNNVTSHNFSLEIMKFIFEYLY